MYRLLFADDEKIVREGVSSRVSWGENGFELAAVVSNGREVLEYMEESPVDVLLSDISMPLMDGLAVCREVSSRFPDTMLLLLTGYDQFEYAQEALKYQVRELILKPITAEELEGVLNRIRGDLDARTRAREERRELQKRLAESLPLLKERFLLRLVLGQLSPEVISRRTEDLHWNDSGGWYQVVLIHLPSSWEELGRLEFTERTQQLLDDNDEMFFNSNENVVLLLQSGESGELGRRSRSLAAKILRSSSRLDASPVFVAVGEVVAEPERLGRSYQGAHRALGHAKLLGLPQVVSAGEVTKLGKLAGTEFHDRVRSLIDCIRTGDASWAEEILSGILTQLEKHYVEPDAADVYLARIQFALQDLVDEIAHGSTEEMPEVLAELYEPPRFTSIPVARDYFKRTIGTIMGFFENKKKAAVVSRIDRAEEVIQERFNEPGLSLQDICDEVFLSVSQFSALFKEKTGKTFVEYLTEVRIDRAKELLLETDLRTYEIADRVGYADPRYFTYVFKKMTGLTSSEFRAGAEPAAEPGAES